MDRLPVISSSIASIGYDESRHVLEIEFLSGSVYRYFHVPTEVYAGLMAASSHGAYFNEAIKPAGYPFTRIFR